MNSIKKILKGFLVGIGSILPGVSGGMIAAAFNIYTTLITALNNVTKEPIKAILSIWQYLLGIGLGVIITLFGIGKLFDLVPIPATLLFIGLIVGSLPDIWFYAKQKGVDLFGYLLIAVTFVMMMIVIVIPTSGYDVANTVWYLWIIVGVLIAVSFIIPGLSGTMILAVIGYYKALLDLFKEALTAVLSFDFDQILNVAIPVLWIGLGLILGALLLAKIMTMILKKSPQRFYQAIVGIIIAAPINIIYSLNLELKDSVDIFDFKGQWLMWLIGLVLLIVGIFLVKLFKGSSNETEENQSSNA